MSTRADRVRVAIDTLIARYGFRFTNLDAERAGVSQGVCDTALGLGLAHIERRSVAPTPGIPEITWYVAHA